MIARNIVYSPIGQASRSERVIERLSNAIVSGLLEAEEQLPNEVDLSRMMGVSPMTVREALNTLRARGLIDTRRGRNGGSFVCRVPEGTLLERHPLRQLTPGELADLGEFHGALIGHAARLAALRFSAGELARLLELINDFATADQPELRAQADMRCLLNLAANAHSARIANQELALQAEWAPLVATLYGEQAIHDQAVRAYRSLHAALLAADDWAACDLVQDLVETLTDHMLAFQLRMDVGQPT